MKTFGEKMQAKWAEYSFLNLHFLPYERYHLIPHLLFILLIAWGVLPKGPSLHFLFWRL